MKAIQFFCVLKSSLMFCFNIPLPLYWEDCFNMFSQIKISCSWAYPLMLRTHFPLHVSNLVSNNSLLTVRVRAADPVADLGLGFQWDCFTATVTLLCFFFFFFMRSTTCPHFPPYCPHLGTWSPSLGERVAGMWNFPCSFFFFLNVLWLHSLWQAGLTFNKQLLSTCYL